MSLVKFNNRRRLFPSWNNDGLRNFLNNDNFFDSAFFEEDGLMPAMNVKETEKDFEIEFAAPGFSKKEFEVSINDNILNVCGEKKIESEQKEDDYTRQEFSYNSFKRSLSLPKSVNADQEIKATYKDGILKLNLKKKETAKEPTKKVIEVL
jgi:HSP20 family protein